MCVHTVYAFVPAHPQYVGTFEVGKGKVDRVAVKRGVSMMQQYTAKSRDATLIICLEGLKVVDGRTQKVAMAHALARVSMCSVDPKHALFGFVAKNPGVQDKYCHVFAMRKQRHADEVHALVSKAFKLAFTKERTIKATKGVLLFSPLFSPASAPSPLVPPSTLIAQFRPTIHGLDSAPAVTANANAIPTPLAMPYLILLSQVMRARFCPPPPDLSQFRLRRPVLPAPSSSSSRRDGQSETGPSTTHCKVG